MFTRAKQAKSNTLDAQNAENQALNGYEEKIEELTSETKKYKITYDANGGTGSMSSDTKIEGVDYVVLANGFTAPSGKAFKEWNTEKDGSGNVYKPDDVYSLEENLPLYAIWLHAYTVFGVGNAVKVGDEEFYVIKDEGNFASNVTLIAKYNLNSSGTAQANTGTNECKFASSKYWSGSSVNINNFSTSTSGDAQYKCVTYGSSKGGTGRLITLGEVNSLKDSYHAIIFGTYASKAYLNYWIGTSGADSDYIYCTDNGWAIHCSYTYTNGMYWRGETCSRN